MYMKISIILFLFSWVAVHPSTSQNMFDLINMLRGGFAAPSGNVIVTTLQNTNKDNNEDDGPQITIVRSIDAPDTNMLNGMFEDFDLDFFGWDPTQAFKSTITEDNQAEQAQVEMIDSSVTRTINKLAKEPSTNQTLLKIIHNEMATVISKVKSTILNGLQKNVGFCGEEKSFLIIMKHCASNCENKAALSRNRRSILNNKINKANKIELNSDRISTLFFDNVPNYQINQEKQDGSKEENIDICLLNGDIDCTNSYIEDIIKCPASSSSKDYLQSSIRQVVQIVNKLFISFVDLALQPRYLDTINYKINVVKSELNDAMANLAKALQSASEFESSPETTPSSRSVKTTVPRHHIVSHELPVSDFDLFNILSNFKLPKIIIPSNVLVSTQDLRQDIHKNEITDHDKESDLDGHSSMEDNFYTKINIDKLPKKLTPSKDFLEGVKRVDKVAMPDVSVNLGKTNGPDLTQIMQMMKSIQDGLNILIKMVSGAQV